MRTFKVGIIAMLLVFTSVSLTNADGFKQKPKLKIVQVTLVQAMGIPGLPAVMLQQLDESMIGCGCQSSYTEDVVHNNVIYLITGSQQEWQFFFTWGGIVFEDDSNIIIN